jgi:hypothetical protein
MTEAEWLMCADPTPMLEFVKDRTSDRKAKLFAAAAFRRLGRLLPDPRQRRGVELLEQMAEGTATPHAVRQGAAEVRRAWPPRGEPTTSAAPVDEPHFVGLMLYRAIASSSGTPRAFGRRAPRHVNGAASHAATACSGFADEATRREGQSRLLRDLFGNPFRPASPQPSWLNPRVVALARTIYDERTFDRISELADALFLAGCENVDVLAHCRGPGPHVRGCWGVDLILGKT